MSCVTSRIVRPSLRAWSQDVVALLLEGGVADGEHLVDEQQVGVDVDHDAKARRTCMPDE